MEIESKNGSKIRVEEDMDFGRGLGFVSTDRTVSRRHVSFKPHEDDDGISSAYFQVKGKNPIWVRHSTNPHIRVYNASQSGQLNIGDSFCLSSKHPVWFNLNKIASADESNRYEEAFAEISGFDHDEIETTDIDDPVQEFGFVVMGREFDCYQKKLIRDTRNWNWFLEEPIKDSDDEEDDEKRSRKKRKKSGKRDDVDDEVWTGESEEEEEDVESIKKLRNDTKPKYSTRSKDKGRKGAGAGASKSVKDDAKKKARSDEDEDEGDETLGGFIVDDEDIGEGDEDDDDNEEEFEEDEDDE
ncbi:putative transcription factor interactor and regulator FHA-SMAD family [Helianthus annuus]|uniref:Putative SMAD/FHA domain-containing protein n=1 Tax=Helianthus annuus TaxID=4232 RepID=A0A251VD30_HELAN|nr:acidic leucine-rich nuclear phosphoprotein 32-related protein [Helianthus annuus]KAF5816885.1 putative SMAD/FHA domain superfamily protein [Helianthus annuus]KAJ0938250.1 putative transcription factor interactor and regulator FHA-SMAD family [Helianthus annuus]KAJ0950261.1 putative transcription factor interactor and regulator FHA-SMAD family [Helianthus annuus]